jgi:1-acyl-sn-glycerol-3-phosphate acyltransferase
MPTRARPSLLLSLQNIYETLAISWPTVVDANLRRGSIEACDARLARWCQRVIANAGIELHVVGRDKVPEGRTFLLMSNHLSLYDVPVLFCVFGGKTRMITKSELFKVPIFGPAIREAGFISIDRQDRHRAIASLHRAKEVLAGGRNVWIAPEGTRSKTGNLLPFKKGGFMLALDTGWPVLPITLQGTGDVLEAKGVRSTAGKSVTVTLHPPIDPTQFGKGGDRNAREALMGAVRQAIASAVG